MSITTSTSLSDPVSIPSPEILDKRVKVCVDVAGRGLRCGGSVLEIQYGRSALVSLLYPVQVVPEILNSDYELIDFNKIKIIKEVGLTEPLDAQYSIFQFAKRAIVYEQLVQDALESDYAIFSFNKTEIVREAGITDQADGDYQLFEFGVYERVRPVENEIEALDAQYEVFSFGVNPP